MFWLMWLMFFADSQEKMHYSKVLGWQKGFLTNPPLPPRYRLLTRQKRGMRDWRETGSSGQKKSVIVPPFLKAANS